MSDKERRLDREPVEASVTPRRRCALRLLAAVLLPALWLVISAAAMWLDDPRHEAVQIALTLLFVIVSGL